MFKGDVVSVETKITEMASEICEREGYVLYDVEYLSSQKVVRIYVDREDGGVNLDDCAKISSGVNFLLDVEDPISNNYNLEVSSPGLERLLRQKWHYEKQIGQNILVVIKSRTETAKSIGAKQIDGILKEVKEDQFVVESKKRGLVECPYEDVHKCTVIFDYDAKLKIKN